LRQRTKVSGAAAEVEEYYKKKKKCRKRQIKVGSL